MNAEIQIQFPQPSERDKFTLTAIYQDADSYTHTDRYTQDDIPADQAPAMSAVVAALVGLAEPWQAAQVWARLGHVTALAPDEPFDPAEIEIEAVELTVEAINPQAAAGCSPLRTTRNSRSRALLPWRFSNTSLSLTSKQI